MQYCSGGELFDYIVAKERLKVRVNYVCIYCNIILCTSGVRSKEFLSSNSFCYTVYSLTRLLSQRLEASMYMNIIHTHTYVHNFDWILENQPCSHTEIFKPLEFPMLGSSHTRFSTYHCSNIDSW